MTHIVNIEPLPGTSIAEEKQVARYLRQEVIDPALRADEEVVLDFAKVEVVTQSFIHALLAEPLCRFPDKALELLLFRNTVPEVKQVILTVIDYTFMAMEEEGRISVLSGAPGSA